MNRTFSSILVAVAIGAIGGSAWAQPSTASPNTGSLHNTVPREVGNGSPADIDYKAAKDACDAKKSADDKAACLRNAKAAYTREQAADKSAALHR
jgi:hypothetical protein